MEQTIQQKRAKFAMDEVLKLRPALKPDEQKEFISYASGLPAMIHTNGLGQAMAFCKLKGKDRAAYKKLYEIISAWLCESPQIYSGCGDILKGITTKDMQSYQLAQVEALALMSWVKKFAKAFLAEE
jgi:CRISPR-associated protein Cmr5